MFSKILQLQAHEPALAQTARQLEKAILVYRRIHSYLYRLDITRDALYELREHLYQQDLQDQQERALRESQTVMWNTNTIEQAIARADQTRSEMEALLMSDRLQKELFDLDAIAESYMKQKGSCIYGCFEGMWNCWFQRVYGQKRKEYVERKVHLDTIYQMLVVKKNNILRTLGLNL